MNMVHYEPWRLLGRFDRQLAPPSRRAPTEGSRTTAGDWLPAVDIREEAERFVIHADLPGVDPKDIDVRMEHGILAIKGQRETMRQDAREGYRRSERVRGAFQRRFSLPDSADAEGITATSQHGVLEVIIPKRHKAQPRRIEVTG